MAEAPRRILAVQIADIGDLILTTPALSSLREAHPTAHITLLTTAHSAPIIAETSLVDDVLTFNRFAGRRDLGRGTRLAQTLRRGNFDTTIFFHHLTTQAGAFKMAAIALAAGSQRRLGLENGRGFFLTDRLVDAGFGARHQAQYWLDLVALLGADPTPRRACVGVSEADRMWALERLPAGRPRVIIHPGSGGFNPARRWSPEAFAAVGDQLAAARGAHLILVGTQTDDGEAVLNALNSPALDLSGKTSLGQLAALLEGADLFIGADSGVMHLAAALRVPLVAIFGPSNPAAWAPWSLDSPAVILSSAPECSPCSYVEHGLGARLGCPARTCMRMVTTKQVLRAAQALLDAQIKPGMPSAPAIKTGQVARTIHILGLPVSDITYEEWLLLIESWIKATPSRLYHVCTINPEFVMIAQRDPIFHHILTRADLTVPDGVGLLWAARRLKTPLRQRVTGSDGVPIVAERAAALGWRLFLLGAGPGVAERAAEVLRARFPSLQIAGTYSGSPAPSEEDAIVELINAARADILFVAYGAPEQDKWIARNAPRLRVCMAMGVGGSLDFIAGVVPRAPLWMQRLGLEWLYRLLRQPWRMRRMLRLPRFVLAVLTRGANDRRNGS
ncbi:MAG: WecB/TagA/CpsF family glycosyltransferase [Aggregatilineales bacterium]